MYQRTLLLLFYPIVFVAAEGYVNNDWCTGQEEPCVIVKQGAVLGTEFFSRSKRPAVAFKGIPYAKPPVGELRFKDPEPAGSWDGMYKAFSDPPMCIQKNYLFPNPKVEGQEDCLYLNVYAPKLQDISDNTLVKERIPVMVYIHGGGWFSGTGNSILHGPDYLLDKRIVLVTFNYRLGVFGFLSTGDDVATGNFAFKDMSLVLKWVQDNIEKFGGDPNRVTIFGQSAGGASVHYLMLSPTTKGLFHRAISQSGTALDLWATPINSLQVAQAQALFVNCPVNVTNTELIDCLRKTDATTLVDSGDKFKVWSIDPLTVFIPTVEKKTSLNPNPFLPDLAKNLIDKGLYNAVPFMTGVMANEGIIRAAPITSQPNLRNDLNARWNELGPILFAIGQSVPENQIADLWKNITSFYMDGEQYINVTNPNSIQNFINMYSDRAFIYGSYQTAVKHAAKNLAPVYFYEMEYAGNYSWSQIFAGTNKSIDFNFNASHCDDLIYLFRCPILFPDFPQNSIDEEFSKKLVTIWANFAKTGKPHKLWKPVTSNKFYFREIVGVRGDTLNTNFLTKRMNFWKQLNITENQ